MKKNKHIENDDSPILEKMRRGYTTHIHELTNQAKDNTYCRMRKDIDIEYLLRLMEEDENEYFAIEKSSF